MLATALRWNMVSDPGGAETTAAARGSRLRKAGWLGGQTVEWAVKLGSAAGAFLAVAAAFHFGPFSERPDVRVDVAASLVNSKLVDTGPAEYICLVNKSGGDVDLLGWELRDAEGSVNRLPDVTLSPDQRLRVHPGGGTNSEADLFGEGMDSVWNNTGDIVTLLDEDGNVIDSVPYGAHPYESSAASCDST
jgi:hypothetical protein